MDWLSNGKVIAYPTEAVYGLGCDPFSESAVTQLLKLKGRSVSKGLILITNDWHSIVDLTTAIPKERLIAVQKTWPGPYTWVFPASEKVPAWLKGQYDTIALRVTAHPIARQICQAYGKPIVSTSANLSDREPVRTSGNLSQVFNNQFNDQIVLIVEGKIGNLSKPTQIGDAITGKILRSNT